MKQMRARAVEIMTLALQFGAADAALLLGISKAAVYASLKRWYPEVTLPKKSSAPKIRNGKPTCVKTRAEQVRDANRRRQAKAKAENKCLKCCKNLADVGHRTCATCRDKMNTYFKLYYARKKSQKTQARPRARQQAHQTQRAPV